MKRVASIGLDIAKDVFQIHGADVKGNTLFNRRLHRSELLPFFKKLPKCRVAMEACSTSHHWGRAIQQYGHDVRLIHVAYVRPFVKRGKTDAIDAEAINEASTRATMRFVEVRSAEHQASGLGFRLRALLLRQRAQLANSLRSHLAEFGVIVPGSGFPRVVAVTRQILERPEGPIPQMAYFALQNFVDQIEMTDNRIDEVERRILTEAKQNDTVRRLMTIPGVGPMVAMAVTALAPDPKAFKSARHFAAWIGLTPKSHSSGSSIVVGSVSKMGNKQLRHLIVIGAFAVLNSIKVDSKRDPWLTRLKHRKPFRVAAVALANKTARVIWALLTKGGVFSRRGVKMDVVGSAPA